jgi:hypothetical protein
MPDKKTIEAPMIIAKTSFVKIALLHTDTRNAMYIPIPPNKGVGEECTFLTSG